MAETKQVQTMNPHEKNKEPDIPLHWSPAPIWRRFISQQHEYHPRGFRYTSSFFGDNANANIRTYYQELSFKWVHP